MDFLDQAQLYFRAEKITGVVVAISAMAMLALAAWLWWMQKDAFARGLASILLVTGITALAGGGFLALKTDSRVARLATAVEQSGAGALAAEGERMEKVVRNFSYYRWMFYAIIFAGLTLLVLLNTKTAIGIAVGLLLFAALGITVDTYAEHRARIYLEAIIDTD